MKALLLDPVENLARLEDFPMIDRPQVCRRCNFRRLCFPRAEDLKAPLAGRHGRQRSARRQGRSVRRGFMTPASCRGLRRVASSPGIGAPRCSSGSWPEPGRSARPRRSPPLRASSSFGSTDARDHDAHAGGRGHPLRLRGRPRGEGGRTYHLFTTEMVGDPMWVEDALRPLDEPRTASPGRASPRCASRAGSSRGRTRARRSGRPSRSGTRARSGGTSSTSPTGRCRPTGRASS